jgi:predicted TIM-barrel fold metal-dependent hydrolase
MSEAIIEPQLPIIDPHHHLWLWTREAIAAVASSDNPFTTVLQKRGRYMLEEFLADLNTGHHILGTVFAEAHAMYKPSGPEQLRSLGEVEWIAGTAAAAESGCFGPIRVAAGIVGNASLSLGEAAAEVLDAHIQAGGGRYRGVRNYTAYDADPVVQSVGAIRPHVLMDKQFRAGFKHLATRKLSYDVWLLEPQIPELIDLARAFPATQIILDHVGTPVGIGSYAGKHSERFPIWRQNIRELATCPNVVVKLGGLGMGVCGLESFRAKPAFSSTQLAAEWKPYIETCIEAFGANRCMFESNFPVDSAGCDYPVLWNAFKRIAAGASRTEKADLFAGTARRVYRLDI